MSANLPEVNVPDPTIYSYTLQDSRGVKATVAVYVAYDATTETVSALLGNWADLGGSIDAITDAKILHGRVIIPALPDPAWKANAVADSDVERTGLFNFRPTDFTYVEGVDIPAISLAVLTADGRIDLSNSNVTAFKNQMTQNTGIGGSNTVFAQNKFDIALKILVDVMTSFRKHRKQLARKTTETP
jgi:hypothetical protein